MRNRTRGAALAVALAMVTAATAAAATATAAVAEEVPAPGPNAAGSPITIAVSPPKFELAIGESPVNEALKVFNFGDEPAEIEVSVHHWSLDADNRVELLPPTEQSLDQWIVINPVRFAVPPGGSQTVRFSIRPKVRPEPGEHRAIVYLQQMPKVDPAAARSMQVVGRLGVAVYGYAGEVERRGEIHRVRVEAEGPVPLALFDVSSRGSAHVRMRGHYTVWPAGLYPGADATGPVATNGAEPDVPEGAIEVGYLPNLPVLPDSRRTLPLRIRRSLPPGNYVLDVEGELSGLPVSLGIPFAVSTRDIARGDRP